MTRRGPDRADVERRLASYLDDVVAGRRVVGELERRGVERHLRDLEAGPARGLRFNVARASRACWWIEANLRFADERWAGKPFHLEPWEVFVVASLFGWERKVGGAWRLRFRKAYLSMARKNAKSTLMAAIALLMLMTGGAAVAGSRWAPLEGAELYSAATTHEQAAISWRAAAKIAKRSPDVRAKLDVPNRIAKTSRFNIAYHDASSYFRALAADSDTLDGLNPYLAIVDELHAHKDGTLLDVLESGMGSRLEPLLLMITTAGADADGVCGDVERDAIKILRQDYSDDSVGDDVFVLICRIDDDDDRFNPAVWPKSNPNLGVSVTLEGLQAQAAAASREPRKLNEFLRKQLNLWTAGVDAWLPAGRWEASSVAADGTLRTVDLEALRGKACYVGVDLGSTNDTTSIGAVWPLDDGEFATWLWTFVPEETISDRSIRGPRERELLQQWVRAGLVIATPGDMVDYDAVWQQILNLNDRYGILEAAFDRWSASSLFGKCEQVGITAVPFGQGYASMSPAMKFAETIIGHRKLIHGGHPVLRWMVSNTATKSDPAGNIKADKSQRTRRIDGTVGMLMALGRAMLDQGAGSNPVFTLSADEPQEEASA